MENEYPIRGREVLAQSGIGPVSTELEQLRLMFGLDSPREPGTEAHCFEEAYSIAIYANRAGGQTMLLYNGAYMQAEMVDANGMPVGQIFDAQIDDEDVLAEYPQGSFSHSYDDEIDVYGFGIYYGEPIRIDSLDQEVVDYILEMLAPAEDQ